MACSKQVDMEVIAKDPAKLEEIKSDLVQQGFTVTGVDTEKAAIQLKVKYNKERIEKAKTLCDLNKNIQKINVKGLFSKPCKQNMGETPPQETKEKEKPEEPKKP